MEKNQSIWLATWSLDAWRGAFHQVAWNEHLRGEAGARQRGMCQKTLQMTKFLPTNSRKIGVMSPST